MSCPFCGSEKIRIETPYIDRVTGKHKTTYCCKPQQDNSRFESSSRRYNPNPRDLEKLEDVMP